VQVLVRERRTLLIARGEEQREDVIVLGARLGAPAGELRGEKRVDLAT
jgi:hypothetical protein